jgi:polyisoprenoid-binding protein YceI
VTLVERAVDAAPGELAQAGSDLPNPRLRLGVPVAALACGNRVMESDMRKALRAAEHPAIVYQYHRVTDLTPLGAHRFSIEVEGDLALAGSKRKVRTQVVGERLAQGLYRVTGEMNLRMTDFGIEPPTALLGMIKARNQLRVRFDLRLKLAEELRTEPGRR